MADRYEFVWGLRQRSIKLAHFNSSSDERYWWGASTASWQQVRMFDASTWLPASNRYASAMLACCHVATDWCWPLFTLAHFFSSVSLTLASKVRLLINNRCRIIYRFDWVDADLFTLRALMTPSVLVGHQQILMKECSAGILRMLENAMPGSITWLKKL